MYENNKNAPNKELIVFSPSVFNGGVDLHVLLSISLEMVGHFFITTVKFTIEFETRVYFSIYNIQYGQILDEK